MQHLAIGEPYLPGRTDWPETVDINPRATGLEVRVFFAHPSEREVTQFRRGRAELALVVCEGLPILAVRYGDLPWMDCPVDIRRVPIEDRLDLSVSLEDAMGLRAAPPRLLVSHVLVDAATGLVQGLRANTLSPTLTHRLLGVWRVQAAEPRRPDPRAVEQFLARHPTPDLVARAEIREDLGSPHTV